MIAFLKDDNFVLLSKNIKDKRGGGGGGGEIGLWEGIKHLEIELVYCLFDFGK